MRSFKVPPWFWQVIRGIISVGLITWLILYYNWQEVFSSIREISIIVIISSLLVMLASQAIMALRLQKLLAAQSIQLEYLRVVRLNFIGLFAGNFLPTTIGGDAVKVVLLASTESKKAEAVSTIVVDRIINMAGIGLYLPLVLFSSKTIALGKSTGWFLTVIATLIGAVSLITASYYIFGKWIHSGHPPAWVNKILNFFAETKRIVTTWVKQPKSLLLALLLSFFAILLSFLAGWLLLTQGLKISTYPTDWIVISVLVYFISLLPISINGWGIQEGSIVVLLTNFGAEPGKALTMAALLRIMTMIISLPGGLGMLFLKKSEK